MTIVRDSKGVPYTSQHSFAFLDQLFGKGATESTLHNMKRGLESELRDLEESIKGFGEIDAQHHEEWLATQNSPEGPHRERDYRDAVAGASEQFMERKAELRETLNDMLNYTHTLISLWDERELRAYQENEAGMAYYRSKEALDVFLS